MKAACELEVKKVEIQKQSSCNDCVNFDPSMNAFQGKIDFGGKKKAMNNELQKKTKHPTFPSIRICRDSCAQ